MKSLEVVAIDGPSGAGKSTIAKAVALRLGWRHLDTGAMYRAVTVWFADHDVDLDDGAAVGRALASLHLRLGEYGRVWIGEQEVTDRLRTRAVERAVSAVSARASVRDAMRDLQRAQARLGPLVAEGRDMTSVVFPDARYKFFVDAHAQERARRRLADFEASGRGGMCLEDVLSELETRDRSDSTRDVAPLIRVPEAVYLDTTDLTVDEVVTRIVDLVEAESGGR